MGPTDNLQRQHQEILALCQRIVELIEHREVDHQAAELRTLLATLGGKLKVHLSMEDDALYPRLKAHHDPLVRSTATRFSEEMGGLKAAFVAYSQKWLAAGAMTAAANEFTSETKVIFGLLRERIAKEERVLYPLLQ